MKEFTRYLAVLLILSPVSHDCLAYTLKTATNTAILKFSLEQKQYLLAGLGHAFKEWSFNLVMHL